MGQPKQTGGTPKKRPRFSLDDDTLVQLAWLYEQDTKKAKHRIYPSDTLRKSLTKRTQYAEHFEIRYWRFERGIRCKSNVLCRFRRIWSS